MRRPRTQPKSETSCTIDVRVVPRSSQVKILVEAPNHYKVKLTSPPVDQAANKQLLAVLADKLSVAIRNIEIISGIQSRNKRLRITGLDLEQVTLALTPS